MSPFLKVENEELGKLREGSILIRDSEGNLEGNTEREDNVTGDIIKQYFRENNSFKGHKS